MGSVKIDVSPDILPDKRAAFFWKVMVGYQRHKGYRESYFRRSLSGIV